MGSRISEIKDRAERNYLAPDGLMKLSPGDERDPYPGAVLRTCNNDNGILFAAYYYWLLEERDELAQIDENRAWRSLVDLRGHIPGIYYRNPGRAMDTEALDNYVGIVAVMVLLKMLGSLDGLCRYGDENGYYFDVVDPDAPRDSHSWRQGADVAFYQLCAGRTPQPFNLLWLGLSFLVNAFQDPRVRTSEYLTNWLRAKALRRARDTYGSGVNLRAQSYFWAVLAAGIWEMLLNLRGGIRLSFDAYFQDPDHPCRQLVALEAQNR